MSETAIIPSSAELQSQQHPPGAMKFFTTNPHELSEVQGKMLAWVRMKISELEAHIVELSAEREIARQNHWAVPPWNRQVCKAERRLEYYQKMQAIMEAGYVMVPSMQMELFAIRTGREQPRSIDRNWPRAAEEDGTGVVALGEGKWVKSEAEVRTRVDETRDANGKLTHSERKYWATGFQDVEFPLDVAKPAIMSRTAAAMAMKAFDELGVVRNANQRRGDPFIIGRIRDPRPTKPGVCFFIGWHIDVSDL